MARSAVTALTTDAVAVMATSVGAVSDVGFARDAAATMAAVPASTAVAF